MKKFIGSIKDKTTSRSKSRDDTGSRQSFSLSSSSGPITLPTGDAPEAVIVREVVAFCDSGAPNNQSTPSDDEYLHLPAIVDAAESSPAAASAAAHTLRRYLSKSYYDKGYAQYNAIMLLRILADNPGSRFTRNFDKDFVKTVKEMLRECRDTNVQQILRETLDYLEVDKLKEQAELQGLMDMWRKEKGLGGHLGAGGSTSGRNYGAGYMRSPSVGGIIAPGGGQGMQQQRQQYQQQERGLPAQDELAARIEEAKSSARLLVQMVQSTPPSEILDNELIKEFSERARQAHRSIQTYMAAENPSPDEATMLTLIETSEQLNIAMTKHQRAILNARKMASSPQPQAVQQDPFSLGGMASTLPQQTVQPPNTKTQTANAFQGGYNSRYSNNLSPSDGAKVPPITVSAVSDNEYSSYTPPTGPPTSQARPGVGTKQYTNPAPNQTYGAPPVSSTPQPQPGFNNSTNTYGVSAYPNYSSTISQVSDMTPPRTAERPLGSTATAPRSPTATQQFGISENPFEDDAYAVPAQTGLPNAGTDRTDIHPSANANVHEMPDTNTNTNTSTQTQFTGSRNPYAAYTSSPPRTQPQSRNQYSPAMLDGTPTNPTTTTTTTPNANTGSGYSVFNRAANQLQSQSQSQSQSQPSSYYPQDNGANTAELAASHEHDDNGEEGTDGLGVMNKNSRKPGPHQGYRSQWAPTPSFLHRQESSGEHFNMSGAEQNIR